MLLQSRLRTPHRPWAIRCLASTQRWADYAKWYERALTVKGRAKLATTLRYLVTEPSERWMRPKAVVLKDHVAVIHFSDENGMQHRITGYFDRKHHAFVMCVFGHEKDDQYQPGDYEERTLRDRSEVAGAFEQRTVAWPYELR